MLWIKMVKRSHKHAWQNERFQVQYLAGEHQGWYLYDGFKRRQHGPYRSPKSAKRAAIAVEELTAYGY